jgi:Fe2+ transport system protein FeoA
MSDVVPLELLPAGTSGRVADVDGDLQFVRRLGEMGLREGARVRMVQPGRPCIVAIGHQLLSLRGDDDLLVLVEPLPQKVAE